MAGKLRGPSSSKASPASTPIPLGTAKHKILKSNDKRYTYLYTFARARARAPHTHRHTHTHIRHVLTHTNTFGRSISREKVLAFLQKHSLSQANRNEGTARKETGKRVNTEARGRERKHRVHKKNETDMKIERRDLMVLRWKSSTTHLLSLFLSFIFFSFA